MTDPATGRPDPPGRLPRIVRVILDASAVAEYGRSEHVGEVLAYLEQELATYLDVDEARLESIGVPAFGVPALSLSTALERATNDKEAHDLILGLIGHPWCIVLPVTAEHVRRPGELGWEQPLPDWTAEIGTQEAAHAVVCAVDHECSVLTKVPEDYAVDGNILEGLLVRIPGDGDTWPDETIFWPTDPDR